MRLILMQLARYLRDVHQPILVSALGQWFLAVIWYSPVVFRKPWLKSLGERAPKKEWIMIFGMILSFFCSLAVSIMLRHVMVWTGTGGLKRGAMFGVAMWCGFVAAPLAGQYILEGRPIKLYFINTCYWLIALALSGAFLARFQ
jgi:hypothetical protein